MATRVLTVDPRHPDPGAIRDAAAVIVRGGLVAFPTETVYGLGAHALDAARSRASFARRGARRPIRVIVHLATAISWATSRATCLIRARLAERFWPGALTLILNKRAPCPTP